MAMQKILMFAMLVLIPTRKLSVATLDSSLAFAQSFPMLIWMSNTPTHGTIRAKQKLRMTDSKRLCHHCSMQTHRRSVSHSGCQRLRQNCLQCRVQHRYACCSPDRCPDPVQNRWGALYTPTIEKQWRVKIPTDFSVGYANDAVQISHSAQKLLKAPGSCWQSDRWNYWWFTEHLRYCQLYCRRRENYYFPGADTDRLGRWRGEAIENGIFMESKPSAPYFSLRIDGITERRTNNFCIFRKRVNILPSFQTQKPELFFERMVIDIRIYLVLTSLTEVYAVQHFVYFF